MTDLIERLRLGDGTSPDHLLLLEAADALEKSVECMCGICKLGQRKWVGLTDDDKVLIKHDANYNQFMTAGEYADRVQQLTEARLKDKNT
jgi:hypothetical protein